MNNTSFYDNKLNTRKYRHAQKRFDIGSENIKHYHQEKKKFLKETKNLLTLSFISIIFCLIALTGTTYAWFTSTISNGNNRIQAGNLDVALLATNSSGGIVDLSSDEATVFDVTSLTLDEPVHAILTVKNKGTIDLKFAIFFNITRDDNPGGIEDTKLSKKLNIYVKEYVSDDDTIPENPTGTMADYAAASGFISNTELSAGSEKKYHVWIKLDPSAEVNVYKNSQITFDISLKAKQKDDTTSYLENN